jgi:hypothetical protein
MAIYYITPIIGTGTKSDPFRTKIAQYGVSQVTVIPTGSDGRPLFTWALVLVATGQVTTAIDADATIDKLPITSLDQTNANTCRDALIAFGKRLDPNFDPNQFSVI